MLWRLAFIFFLGIVFLLIVNEIFEREMKKVLLQDLKDQKPDEAE